MQLLAIHLDETRNAAFHADPDCQAVLQVMPDFYARIGFHPPWIGYFIANEADELRGSGGFKGQPKDGKIEIAYGTFKQYEGQGVGTAICRALVLLAVKTDPAVKITARTLPENGASARILQKNGFKLLGTIWDEEDGEVWEWEYQHSG